MNRIVHWHDTLLKLNCEREENKRMSRLNSHELILIRRAVGQDYDAITELYDLYSPRLKRFLGRIIQDRETIEELVNDTMLIV